jgi:hypothetical protein
MSEPEVVVERSRFVVGPTGLYVVDGGELPVTHFGGMSLHAHNLSATPIDLSLQDSDDGVTWSVLLFSDTASGGLLTKRITGLGQEAILFETRRRYLQVTVNPGVEEGVLVVLSQFPPRGPQGAGLY